MSENIVYESNAGYEEGDWQEIAPNVFIRVTDINLHYWVDSHNFNMIVTIQVIEGDINNTQIVGLGYATITGHPGWDMVSHQVYLDSNAFRDVFIAVTGFNQVQPGQFQVTIHTKILPFISFVWLGAFLMMTAMFPMFAIEAQALLNSIRGKEKDLYDEVLDDVDESATENPIN